MEKQPLLIALLPEETFGPLNNFIGIANVLTNDMGHRVIFLLDSHAKGKASKYGFEEKYYNSSKNSNDDNDESFDEMINRSLVEFRKSPFEQWKTFVFSNIKNQIKVIQNGNEDIKNLLEEIKPDIIVQDIYVTSPAIINNKNKIPFIRFMSGNPLAIPDGHAKPPVNSGVSAQYSSPSEIKQCWNEFDRIFRSLWNSFNHWIQNEGCTSLPDLDFVQSSTYLNIYVYPQVMDYHHALNDNDKARWFRINSCVRDIDPEFQFPEKLLRQIDAPLIYVSLGTLGCEDVELMKKLIDILSRTKYRCIFSLGSKHEQFYPLPKNIWGDKTIPQTKVIPLVDMVITHGGNNTVTDCFHFGKPMLVLPMFWDQHDNAIRINETRYGIRLDTYTFTEQQINDALKQLLSDEELKMKLTTISEQIKDMDGIKEAAQQIERVARQYQN
ncbi:unnamed protein product [Adineta steineri]|uniref:Uncharacterized protein n=1 Tax=Adineta steineri TaxID=433720 RepID=A0A814LKY3_9BILA|nr:unnamed protein product [Adineta steineri]CAF1066109.1 unnamed protein product [Adineta steineri]CAF3481984.1 unnamed protein product [Adineta steineri]CAF3499095.1 unnamed protein product [Adineta steineri]